MQLILFTLQLFLMQVLLSLSFYLLTIYARWWFNDHGSMLFLSSFREQRRIIGIQWLELIGSGCHTKTNFFFSSKILVFVWPIRGVFWKKIYFTEGKLKKIFYKAPSISDRRDERKISFELYLPKVHNAKTHMITCQMMQCNKFTQFNQRYINKCTFMWRLWKGEALYEYWFRIMGYKIYR